MKKALLYILPFIAGLSLSLALRSKPIPPITPPAVVIHDTVKSIDTLRIRQTIEHQAKPDTVWLERVTVQVPETVTVVPAISGVTGLLTSNIPGDTMFVMGIHVRPLGAEHYTLQPFTAVWLQPGPLHGLLVDSTGAIRAAFYPSPPRPCQFGCKAKLVGEGGILGVTLYIILHGLK